MDNLEDSFEDGDLIGRSDGAGGSIADSSVPKRDRESRLKKTQPEARDEGGNTVDHLIIVVHGAGEHTQS